MFCCNSDSFLKQDIKEDIFCDDYKYFVVTKDNLE